MESTSSEAEVARMMLVEQSGKAGKGRGGSRLSATEKEKTKLRERQRRSITTKIFSGLRKHGGYNLPPRADINDVLRALATEAGFIVEADGTTYRAPQQPQGSGCRAQAGREQCFMPPPVEHQFGAAATMGGRRAAVGSFRERNSICTTTMERRGQHVGEGSSSTTASPCRIPNPVTASSSSLPHVLRPASGLSSPANFASPASSEDVTANITCRSFTALDHDQLSLSLAKDEFPAHAPPGFQEPGDGGLLMNSGLGHGLADNFPTSIFMLHDHDQHPLLFQETWASNRNSSTGSPQSQM